MAFRFKRQQTPFGVMVHKRGPGGTNLLITKNGRNLGLRHGEKLGSLLRSFRVDKNDRVSFAPNVHPKQIGAGVHAMVFRVFPAEEAQFVAARKPGLGHLPSVVLKLYKESVAKKDKPDGFTQFFANSFVFNYLKKLPGKSYVVRPLQTYFVSEKLLARKYINAPTLGDAFRAFKGIRLENGKFSTALEDKQIIHFLERNKITERQIDRLDSELEAHVMQGAKAGFNTGFNIVPDFTHMENAFILGKTKAGQPAVSVIDQGKESIPNLGNMIRKGKLFLPR